MNALELIESRLTFVDDNNWPARDVAEKALIVVRDVTNATLLAYQQLRGDAVKQAELAEAVRLAYAKYVAPIDIPGVGAVIESIIDNQLPNILAGLVTGVDAQLDKVLPNPVPAPTPTP